MRQDAQFFDGAELDLLFIAKKLREALKLEALLTEAGIDYFVETDSYSGGVLFRRELTGAFFYVMPADANRTRELLVGAGYKPYAAETR